MLAGVFNIIHSSAYLFVRSTCAAFMLLTDMAAHLNKKYFFFLPESAALKESASNADSTSVTANTSGFGKHFSLPYLLAAYLTFVTPSYFIL